MTDDIVTRLRDWNDGERLTSPSYTLSLTLSDVANEIERLRGLVAELLPAALNDAVQGVSIGPPPEGNDFCQHCEQTCMDCEWYDQSIAFMERYDNGYYSID